jgi:ArsR family transcriptional regulator
LSKAVAQARVTRLVNLGLADTTCTPNERIVQLRSRIEEGEATYRELEDFFSALGDTTRLKMVKLIADEELCSCEVMAALELTQPTTSHHLGILEQAGILTSKRNGKWVFYKISNSRIHNLINKAFSVAEAPMP